MIKTTRMPNNLKWQMIEATTNKSMKMEVIKTIIMTALLAHKFPQKLANNSCSMSR